MCVYTPYTYVHCILYRTVVLRRLASAASNVVVYVRIYIQCRRRPRRPQDDFLLVAFEKRRFGILLSKKKKKNSKRRNKKRGKKYEISIRFRVHTMQSQSRTRDEKMREKKRGSAYVNIRIYVLLYYGSVSLLLFFSSSEPLHHKKKNSERRWERLRGEGVVGRNDPTNATRVGVWFFFGPPPTPRRARRPFRGFALGVSTSDAHTPAAGDHMSNAPPSRETHPVDAAVGVSVGVFIFFSPSHGYTVQWK